MCPGLSPAPAFGTATSRLLLPCSLSFRDEYDGGGLGDEAGAARCHRRQLARNAGPDRLPGALMVATAQPRTPGHASSQGSGELLHFGLLKLRVCVPAASQRKDLTTMF